MARPKGSEKPIDLEKLKQYARVGCTQIEIAGVLGISIDTLERRLKRKEVRDMLNAGQAELFTSLRTKQVQLALNGHPTMLIWLGKQYLGQHDKHDLTGKDGAPLLTERDSTDEKLAAYNAAKTDKKPEE